MSGARFLINSKLVYCICPNCNIPRKIINNQYNIVRRGYERNGLSRFLCLSCKTWFNEQTGKTMQWLGRT